MKKFDPYSFGFALLSFCLIQGVAMAASSSVVLIADPRVLAIPVVENHEPMVNVRIEGGILLGPSPEIYNSVPEKDK